MRHWSAARGVGVCRRLGLAKGERSMSDATDRQEMERRLIERSLEDDAFKGRLLEDPKGVVEQELGKRLPEGVRVVAVEETADTIYLVLPSATAVGEGGELSDQQLDAVAGGWEHSDAFPTEASCASCGC